MKLVLISAQALCAISDTSGPSTGDQRPPWVR